MMRFPQPLRRSVANSRASGIAQQARPALNAVNSQARPLHTSAARLNSEDGFGHKPIADVLKDFERTRSGHFIPFKKGDPSLIKLDDYEHPDIPRKKFVKSIRPPHGLYNATIDVLTRELRANQDLSNVMFEDQNLHEMLTETEMTGLFDSILANILFAKNVAKRAEYATKATMLFPSSLYSHMNVGLGNYCAEQKGKSVEDSFRFVTYYRSGLMMEEIYRLGFTREQAIKKLAKDHFLQYHNGDPFGPGKDPEIYSHFKRVFYPAESHISEGSTDLGRDHEFETARLWAHAYEGNDAPVTVL